MSSRDDFSDIDMDKTFPCEGHYFETTPCTRVGKPCEKSAGHNGPCGPRKPEKPPIVEGFEKLKEGRGG